MKFLGAELVVLGLSLALLVLSFGFVLDDLRFICQLALVDKKIRVSEFHVLLLIAPLVCRVSRLFATKALSWNLTGVEIADPDVVEFVPLVRALGLKGFLLLDVRVVVAAISSATMHNNTDELVLVVGPWLLELLEELFFVISV